MSGLPVKLRHPFVAMVLLVLGGVCLLLALLGQNDWFTIWTLAAAVCWFACWSSLAHWVAAAAATSSSPVLRAIERVRSCIADEPASFEITRQSESKRP